MAQEIEVGEDAAGERLDAFLAPHVGSRTNAAKLIAEGSVTVDGRVRQKRHTVAVGQRVLIAEPQPAAVAAEADQPAASEVAESASPFAVAYVDEYLIVVDKPAGLVVHPGRGHWEGTLSQTLGLDVERGGVVHRLDKETSGLLVVAKTERVQRELQAMIKSREVHREYLALVAGRPESRNGTIDAPIGRDRHVRTMHSLDTDTPREARTHFALLEALPSTSLLEVRLETGRTHQIRVHMQAIGHPVIGDPVYGGAGGTRYGTGRQFLHAARLRFAHPVGGELVDVVSPLPDDLQATLDAARAG